MFVLVLAGNVPVHLMVGLQLLDGLRQMVLQLVISTAYLLQLVLQVIDLVLQLSRFRFLPVQHVLNFAHFQGDCVKLFMQQRVLRL